MGGACWRFCALLRLSGVAPISPPIHGLFCKYYPELVYADQISSQFSFVGNYLYTVCVLRFCRELPSTLYWCERVWFQRVFFPSNNPKLYVSGKTVSLCQAKTTVIASFIYSVFMLLCVGESMARAYSTRQKSVSVSFSNSVSMCSLFVV